MTLVKVIDSTTWAGLTELDIAESDDLSNSLANDTYRLIHSATTALVVAAVSIVSGAPAAISLTAYPASVSIGGAAVTVTSATPAAITLTKYAATVSVEGGGIQSDDFSSTLSGFWTFSDPASAGSTAATSSGNLEIAVVDGVTYDIYNATNNAPRVLQTLASDPGDFDIRIALVNNPSEQYQNVGFYVQASNGDHLRADVYSTSTTVKTFGATTVGTTTTGRVDTTIGSLPGVLVNYLRLTRATNTWSLYTSTNGTDWTQQGSSWAFTMDIEYVGLWAASQGAAGAFTAQISDFTVV